MNNSSEPSKVSVLMDALLERQCEITEARMMTSGGPDTIEFDSEHEEEVSCIEFLIEHYLGVTDYALSQYEHRSNEVDDHVSDYLERMQDGTSRSSDRKPWSIPTLQKCAGVDF